MLYIILDTVIDIWNKTYIKLPISQLEILRDNKTTIACDFVDLNCHNNVELPDVKALQYFPTKIKTGMNFVAIPHAKAQQYFATKTICRNSPNQLSVFPQIIQLQNNATEGAIQGYPVRVETLKKQPWTH